MHPRFWKRDYPDPLTKEEARSMLGSDRFLAPTMSYPEVFVRIAKGLRFEQFVNVVTITTGADDLELHFLTADKAPGSAPTGVTSIAIDEDVATWLVKALQEAIVEYRGQKAEAEADEEEEDEG